MGGIDDLFRQMELDDLADQVELTTHATPIEYARARGIVPQKVYYALRNHRDKINTEQCKCGRKVLNIEAADIYFGFKEIEDEETNAEPEDGDKTRDGDMQGEGLHDPDWE
jgi:hypothetical protein